MTKPTSIKTYQLTVCECDDTPYIWIDNGDFVCTVCGGVAETQPKAVDEDIICPLCHGNGRRGVDDCPVCGGKGDLW